MTPELLAAVGTTARDTAGWYADYTTPEDVRQELAVYALSHQTRLQGWLDGGQPHRVRLALRGAVREFGERERARTVGVEYSDASWYSPALVKALLPMALSWDGDIPKGSSGEATLIGMLVDVGQALGHNAHLLRLKDFDSKTEAGQEGLAWLCDRLGGKYPGGDTTVGQGRRAVSNATAQWLTARLTEAAA